MLYQFFISQMTFFLHVLREFFVVGRARGGQVEYFVCISGIYTYD